jgi:transcriptional regulator with XRE-family HTH domain
MNFGKRIRKRRIELGLTPGQAAYKAGFSDPYWRQIESGQRIPRKVDTLQRLADVLNWTIADLLATDDENACSVDSNAHGYILA